MRALVIGQNSKIAGVFSLFCDHVFMAVDKKISNYRSYSENNRFTQLDTSLDIRSPKSILPRAFEIRRWVTQNNIDVVFTNDKYSMIAAKLAKLSFCRNFIHLSTSHNSYAWIDDDNVRKFSRLIKYTCDGYISMASFSYKKLLASGLSSQRVLLQPNTLERGLFSPKCDYSINEGVLKLVYTAAIYPGKRQDICVEVVKILNDRGIKTTIDLFGEIADVDFGEYVHRLVNEKSLHTQVFFHGRVENDVLRKNLCKYDIYICPTKMEMSPFNILEAQQAGLPIVCACVGGIPDLVRNGYNGILIDNCNSENLANSIEYIYTDKKLRTVLGENAKSFVNEEQSPEVAAKKMRSFIQTLIR